MRSFKLMRVIGLLGGSRRRRELHWRILLYRRIIRLVDLRPRLLLLYLLILLHGALKFRLRRLLLLHWRLLLHRWRGGLLLLQGALRRRNLLLLDCLLLPRWQLLLRLLCRRAGLLEWPDLLRGAIQ